MTAVADVSDRRGFQEAVASIHAAGGREIEFGRDGSWWAQMIYGGTKMSTIGHENPLGAIWALHRRLDRQDEEDAY